MIFGFCLFFFPSFAIATTSSNTLQTSLQTSDSDILFIPGIIPLLSIIIIVVTTATAAAVDGIKQISYTSKDHSQII